MQVVQRRGQSTGIAKPTSDGLQRYGLRLPFRNLLAQKLQEKVERFGIVGTPNRIHELLTEAEIEAAVYGDTSIPERFITSDPLWIISTHSSNKVN